MMTAIRRYSEFCKLETFEDRFNYLKLNGIVSEQTFGSTRYLNQALYQRSKRWKQARDIVIARDNACDLGVPGYDIYDQIFVHHMNPITPEDLMSDSDDIYNPEYLICTSFSTHNAVHYGDSNLLIPQYVERFPGDTKLW